MGHYHHGNLHEALIQSGCDELDNVGPSLLSLRQIARRAGVSHNAPYRHFAEKDALIIAICERTAKNLVTQIEQAPLIYPVSLLLQMQFVGRLFVDLAKKHPHRVNLLFGPPRDHANKNDKMQILETNMFQALNSILEQGAHLEGLPFRSHLALTFLSAIRGYSLALANRPADATSIDEAFEEIDAIVENILMPSQAS